MSKKKIKLAVVGSRYFTDYQLVKKEITKMLEDNTIVIVSGGARGADTLGKKAAEELNLETEIYHADWDTFGKSAGYIRNKLIEKNADQCLAFMHKDKENKGTKITISLFGKNGKTVNIIEGV